MEWAFDAQVLQKFAKSLRGDVVEFTVTGDVCHVECGNSDADFPRLSMAILPVVQSLEGADLEYKAVPTDFDSAIGLCVMPGTASDLHRGILVDSGCVMASDGQRVSHFAMECDNWPHVTFRLDEPQAIVLSKARGVQALCVDMAWVHFRCDNGVTYHLKRCDHSGYRLSAERVEGLFKATRANAVMYSGKMPSGLKEAINAAMTVSADFQTDNGKISKLVLDIKQDHVMVRGESGAGKIKRKVPMDEPLATDPNLPEIVVFGEFLIEAGNKAMQFAIYAVAPIKDKDGNEITRPPVMLFESDKFTHMVTCGK